MALRESKVEEGYIYLLQNLYNDQKGTVKFGVQSDEFNIERGTKQGDPVSTALFNAVLELCMRRTKKKMALLRHQIYTLWFPGQK